VKRLRNALLRLRRRDDGASAVEYGLLVALIAVIIAVAVATLGANLNEKFQDVGECVDTATSAACAPGGGGAPPPQQ
jgi:pilus assembly protein Flp/PilA